MKNLNEIISKYNFVYDNELKALEKEFILRADNNDKFFDVIVTDEIVWFSRIYNILYHKIEVYFY